MPVRVIAGDCRTALQELPSESMHCILTSPPYYNLRSYLPDGHADKPLEIGLEASPESYVAELVSVFREAKRVLRNDGVLWLNIGDSYAAGGNGVGSGKQLTNVGSGMPRKTAPSGIKPKDLIGIPWMVAFALRADGWYLRQDNIWHKPSCMPESVTDRTTRSHEYVFMFSKRSSYFYDAQAIAEPEVMKPQRRLTPREANPDAKVHGQPIHRRPEGGTGGGTRNKRSVWTIATEPSGLGHYAMMPTALAEICIKAGTSERGCCPTCAAPWSRAVEKRRFRDGEPITGSWNSATDHRIEPTGIGHWRDTQETRTVGWSQSCVCPAHDPVPATILDPFAGAGTTGLVADRLGRSAILIELSETNAAMARNRLEGDAGLFAEVSAG